MAQQEAKVAIDPAAQDKTGMVKVEDHSKGIFVSEDWMPAIEAAEYLRKKQEKAQQLRANPPDYSGLPTASRMAKMEENHQKYDTPLPYKNQVEADQYYKNGVYKDLFTKFELLENKQLKAYSQSTALIPEKAMIEVQVDYKTYDASELQKTNIEELDARDFTVREDILSRLPNNSYEELDRKSIIAGFMRLNLSKQALTLLYEDSRIEGFVEQSILDDLDITAF